MAHFLYEKEENKVQRFYFYFWSRFFWKEAVYKQCFRLVWLGLSKSDSVLLGRSAANLCLNWHPALKFSNIPCISPIDMWPGLCCGSGSWCRFWTPDLWLVWAGTECCWLWQYLEVSAQPFRRWRPKQSGRVVLQDSQLKSCAISRVYVVCRRGGEWHSAVMVSCTLREGDILLKWRGSVHGANNMLICFLLVCGPFC